jgi:alpha-galactosidase
MPTETDTFTAYGDCLMEAGLRPKQRFVGTGYTSDVRLMPDYAARIYHLKAE